MTTEEALNLRTFENYCTCGGYAWQTNGRPESNPHMDWCPQRDEYLQWYAAMKKGFPDTNKPMAEIFTQHLFTTTPP